MIRPPFAALRGRAARQQLVPAMAAEHFTPEQRQQIISSYPVHERDARTKGVPILGSGRIFPVSVRGSAATNSISRGYL